MRLKHLKIAGFKSFVDPTVLVLPSQRIGIVGPNGCGKSNIIDALRWVIGESAAKNLRGESMVDVIFNGSSSRKAVGQASVEVVFENHLGRLTGQYSSYQDISIKRTITRDGDSNYYLNGSRCRRRDVIDIFLGTGASSRGYSIIGQGTISRIIEAKPEELRLFIEEAAGVSKYKERRRETLTRIQNTQQNIERAQDISFELENQLQRLADQAKTTKYYQTLKQQEHLTKLTINAFKWHRLEENRHQVQRLIQQSVEEHNQRTYQLITDNQQITTLKEQIATEQESLEAVQVNFYQLNTEIELIKKTRLHQEQEEKRLITAIQTTSQTITCLNEDNINEQQKLNCYTAQQVALGEQLSSQRQVISQQTALLKQFEDELSIHTKRWETVYQDYSSVKQALQVNKIKEEHITSSRAAIYHRLEKIQHQEQQVNDDYQRLILAIKPKVTDDLQQEKKELDECYKELQLQEELQALQIKQIQATLESTYQQNRELLKIKTTVETQMNTLLQKAPQQQEANTPFPYLFQLMSVESNWQFASEWVLGLTLQAKVVEHLKAIYIENSWSSNDESFTTENRTLRSLKGTLASKIQGVIPHNIVDLNKVFTAETLDQAIELLPTLKEDESVITPNGYWVSNHWIKISRQSNRSLSLLTLQAELKANSNLLQCNELIIQEKEQELKQVQLKKTDIENRKLTCNNERLQLESQIILAINTLEQQKKSLVMLEKSKQQLSEEQEEIVAELEDLLLQADQLDERLKQDIAAYAHLEASLKILDNQKVEQDSKVKALRLSVDEAKLRAHQTHLQQEREQSQIKHTMLTIARINSELASNKNKQLALEKSYQTLVHPDHSSVDILGYKIAEYDLLQKRLNEQREFLKQCQLDLKLLEGQVKKKEHSLKALEEKRQQDNLLLQTLMTQKDSLIERLHEQNTTLEQLIEVHTGTTSLAEQENYLLEITANIGSLGAINLAALAEFQNESKRKQDLDNQLLDLNNALATLELAIKKIDGETAIRIKETFDAVNHAFSSLFPRLFGGGHAQLKLTCDNLLEAGILIMAQPPGKRNSTIYLLSGGEKALTAVALVFAIFQLNPSPFCLLDEVDAPLDDTNISRFCALVKEMSEQVQFIFITHSKITMELADHLIGVTMQEAGVSRLVAVDVKEALAMIE